MRITCAAPRRSLRPPSCCSVLVMNGAFGAAAVRLLLDRADGERRVGERRRPALGRGPRRRRRRPSSAGRRAVKSLPVATLVPSSATSVAVNAGDVAGEQIDVPVAGGDEGDALALALDDQAHRRALHATGRQAAVDAPPQHRRHLVPVEPVEQATGLGGVDQAVVDAPRVGDGVVDGGLGDLVEHHPLHRDLRLQVLEEVPADGLALAVLVRREVQLAGVLHRRSQVLDHVLAADGQLVRGLEAVVDVDRQTLARQVGDVAHRGAHVEGAAQELGEGLGLGGRFDDDEWLGHGVRIAT